MIKYFSANFKERGHTFQIPLLRNVPDTNTRNVPDEFGSFGSLKHNGFRKRERCESVLEVLKSGNKAIGIKQTLKAVESDTARIVFIARDADEKIVAALKELCISKSVEIEYVEAMKLLGKACGIEVGASAVCLLK